MKSFKTIFLSFMLMFLLGAAVNGQTTCQILMTQTNSNPIMGQQVSYKPSCLIPCKNVCYANYSNWLVTGPPNSQIEVNGILYTGQAMTMDPIIGVTFHSPGTFSISMDTYGQCDTAACNIQDIEYVTVEIPVPDPVLIRTDLIDSWQAAGRDESLVPVNTRCYEVTDMLEEDHFFEHNGGIFIKENVVRNLAAFVSDPNTLSILHFKAGDYYFDKGHSIVINDSNVIISGDGASETIFHVAPVLTPILNSAETFLKFRSNSQNSGISCLSILTNEAFPSGYHHERDHHEKFKNKSLIVIEDANNILINGVLNDLGYGSTVYFTRSRRNSITGCEFQGTWTRGSDGGTQGYVVNMQASDFNLVENCEMRGARHGVLVQGDLKGSTDEAHVSSFNVIGYNFITDMVALNKGWTQTNSWDITFHGAGENHSNLVEGNLCEDRIAVDNEDGANGSNNTFYRNLSKTQIEVQKVGLNCNGNSGQRFIHNSVWKKGIIDRYQIKADDHLIMGNSKCNSTGGGCNTGTFSAGTCGFSSNDNTLIPSTVNAGLSAYLTDIPFFLDNFPLPAFSISSGNEALVRTTIDNVTGCFCSNERTASPNQESYPTPAPKPVGARTPVIASSILEPTFNLYPNPFTQQSTLELELPATQEVSISLINLNGQKVRLEYKGNLEAGTHKLSIDAEGLPKGIYFLHIQHAQGNKVLRVSIM